MLLHKNVFGFLKKTDIFCVSGTLNLFLFLSIPISILRDCKSRSFRNMKLHRQFKYDLKRRLSVSADVVPDADVIAVFLYKKLFAEPVMRVITCPIISVRKCFECVRSPQKSTGWLRATCSWTPSGFDVSYLIYCYHLSCRV